MGDAYKKKIEEYFPQDKKGRVLAIVESLRIHNPNCSNIIQNEGKSFPWKSQALTLGFEMIRTDLDVIVRGLQEAKERIEKSIDYKSKSHACNETTAKN